MKTSVDLQHMFRHEQDIRQMKIGGEHVNMVIIADKIPITSNKIAKVSFTRLCAHMLNIHIFIKNI